MHKHTERDREIERAQCCSMSTTEYLHLHASAQRNSNKNRIALVPIYIAFRCHSPFAYVTNAFGTDTDCIWVDMWYFCMDFRVQKPCTLLHFFSPYIYMLSRIYCMSPVICDGIQYLRWYDVDWPQFPSATSILYASCNDIIKMTFTTAKTSQKKMCKQLNSQPKWRW